MTNRIDEGLFQFFDKGVARLKRWS